MRIRPIRADELDLFVEAGGTPSHRDAVRQYVENMLALGSMRPEWCFVVEQDGRPVGRVAFWTLPGMDEPFALVLLDVAWEEDYLDVGSRLLEDVLRRARGLGAGETRTRHRRPADAAPVPIPPGASDGVVGECRFPGQARDDTRRVGGFVFSHRAGKVDVSHAAEVGREDFVDAMMRVSEGSLDQRDPRGAGEART